MLCYDISNCLHQYTSRSKSFNTFVFSTITISILRVCKISHILLYCQQSYRFRRQTIRKISLHDCRKICKQTTCKEYINLKSKVNEKSKTELTRPAVRSVTLNLANRFSQCTFSVAEHYDLFSDLVILRQA